MGREIEIKLALPDPAALRERLRAAGAACEGDFFERSVLLDTPERRLANADCGLRIRERWRIENPVVAPPARPPDSARLTFKGPRQAGPIKVRDEVETDISDASAAIDLLSRLGFAPAVVCDKRREFWRLPDAWVCIDELPGFGPFVEIEGPSESSVAQWRLRLRLGDAPVVYETYVELAVRHGLKRADGVCVLEFPGAV